MSKYWTEQEYGLRFQLSDVTLFSANVPILAHACTLPEILGGRAPCIPPELPPSSRGYLIRSCPGLAPERTLERAGGGYLAYTMAAYEHCYIDLQGTFADYQAKFSSKSRGTITRKVKKFAAESDGRMHFERYARPEELRRFHELARRVSTLTYQERLLDVGLPVDQEFMKGMMAAAQDDRVRAFLLFEEDKPVAYLYCPIVEGVVVYAYLGFDPSYSDRSPGTVLLWLSLESLFSEGAFSFLDFTEGSSPQKQFFSTGRVPCYNRLYLRRGVATQALLRGHRAFDQGSLRLGRFLDRLGLKKKIKHLLRGT